MSQEKKNNLDILYNVRESDHLPRSPLQDILYWWKSDGIDLVERHGATSDFFLIRLLPQICTADLIFSTFTLGCSGNTTTTQIGWNFFTINIFIPERCPKFLFSTFKYFINLFLFLFFHDFIKTLEEL